MLCLRCHGTGLAATSTHGELILCEDCHGHGVVACCEGSERFGQMAGEESVSRETGHQKGF
jgi:hypothetical protein